jgi:peptidyl-tRNA hydrolase, PTH1 family
VSPFGRRQRDEPRRGTPSDLLVVGLGNPGAQYKGTRHNMGVEVVETLAARHDGRLRKGKELALADEVRIGESRVALAWPQTFMNNSGDSVRLLVSRYGIEDPARLVVVHDELDLPVGRLKLKLGGGLAGNNGLKSIKAHLGTDEFARVRVGIGKPSSARQGADHVLRPPGKAERTELDVVVQEAADAVELILDAGFEAAMNRYNTAPSAD